GTPRRQRRTLRGVAGGSSSRSRRDAEPGELPPVRAPLPRESRGLTQRLRPSVLSGRNGRARPGAGATATTRRCERSDSLRADRRCGALVARLLHPDGPFPTSRLDLMPAEGGRTDPRFVGRDGELRKLVAAFERARAGHGRLVAVCGEAGIGKTRLVEELVRATALPPGRVLRGRCLEQEGAPSYWPWGRVLRAYVAARGLDGVRSDAGGDAMVLGAIVPELVPPGASGPAIASGSELEARYRLFEAAINLIRAASTAPLLIALEDMHWADAASLAVLEFVAHELDGTHLLLLVTYRDRTRPRLPRPLVEAVRCGEHITLRGLDGAAVAALAAHEAGSDVPAALVDRLAEVTAGNPYFLGEVLRALKEEGRLGPSLPS